jgi:hypothetical protein
MKPDVSVYHYLNNLEECDLMKYIFPHFHVNKAITELPNNKIVVLAYLLNNNDVEHVKNFLSSSGYSSIDVDNVCNLIKLSKFSSNNIINPETIYEIFTKPFNLHMSKIKDFFKLIKKDNVYDKLFGGKLDDIMKKYIETEGNSRMVNPLYIQHMGKTLRPDELEMARKSLFHHRIHHLMSGS